MKPDESTESTDQPLAKFTDAERIAMAGNRRGPQEYDAERICRAFGIPLEKLALTRPDAEVTDEPRGTGPFGQAGVAPSGSVRRSEDMWRTKTVRDVWEERAVADVSSPSDLSSGIIGQCGVSPSGSVKTHIRPEDLVAKPPSPMITADRREYGQALLDDLREAQHDWTDWAGRHPTDALALMSPEFNTPALEVQPIPPFAILSPRDPEERLGASEAARLRRTLNDRGLADRVLVAGFALDLTPIPKSPFFVRPKDGTTFAGAERERIKADISMFVRGIKCVVLDGGAEVVAVPGPAGEMPFGPWQLIATAPKDGTDILIAHRDGVSSGHWHRIGWSAGCSTPGYLDGEMWLLGATHWASLPKHPVYDVSPADAGTNPVSMPGPCKPRGGNPTIVFPSIAVNIIDPEKTLTSDLRSLSDLIATWRDEHFPKAGVVVVRPLPATEPSVYGIPSDITECHVNPPAVSDQCRPRIVVKFDGDIEVEPSSPPSDIPGVKLIDGRYDASALLDWGGSGMPFGERASALEGLIHQAGVAASGTVYREANPPENRGLIGQTGNRPGGTATGSYKHVGQAPVPGGLMGLAGVAPSGTEFKSYDPVPPKPEPLKPFTFVKGEYSVFPIPADPRSVLETDAEGGYVLPPDLADELMALHRKSFARPSPWPTILAFLGVGILAVSLGVILGYLL